MVLYWERFEVIVVLVVDKWGVCLEVVVRVGKFGVFIGDKDFNDGDKY